jgi:transcriptional regulator with XRE-family HTH domain
MRPSAGTREKSRFAPASREARQPDRGARIRRLRLEGGKSQRYVADQLGVAPRSIQNWEAGEPIAYPNLVALARLFDTTPEWIDDGIATEDARDDDADLAARTGWLEARARHDTSIIRYELRDLTAAVKRMGDRVEALERQVAAVAAAQAKEEQDA